MQNNKKELYESLDNPSSEQADDITELNQRAREQFYWRLYYLIDDKDNLTKLGRYYKLIYTHHYLQALKEYISLSETIKEKNKIFFKNEKAREYLHHFEKNIKKEKGKTWIKQIRR